MNSNEQKIRETLGAAETKLREGRRWLARFCDEHPNTAAGYVIVTFPFAVYGIAKFIALIWAAL